MTTFEEIATREQETVEADAENPAPQSKDDTTHEESEVSKADEVCDDQPDNVRNRRRGGWSRVLALGVLPGLALLLAVGSAYFKWVAGSADDLAQARAESVRVASEDTVALLSYKPDSVDKDLGAARERLTGEFRDAYTTLTREVVIPGAKEKRITAVAKVNAAALVSATASHAVVLLFVNQTVTIGEGAPTDTQPVVRATLEKVNGRWLVSHFDPV